MPRFLSIPSPIGPLCVAADDDGVRAIEFPVNSHPVARDGNWHEGPHPLIDATARQLDEYFSGRRRGFDLPLAPVGTDFQKAVWTALQQIPFGSTWSYGQLATRIGNPKASRAVGAANGRNPIPIVIPCHRVIGSGGTLVGFGGGIPAKEFLLRLEGIQWR